MNAIIESRIESMDSSRCLVIGSYTAGRVQRAIRSALGKRFVRGVSAKRASRCFDMKADGSRVEL
jgi:hypothetical protein